MRIAVINEGSTKHRNGDVMKALEGLGHEIINLGMKNQEGEPDLTYLETGLLTALALNLGAADFVVGGCGTGQGYMNAVLQFPGTACGLMTDPAEAFLFSKVNAGNCVSLPLNKGYGGIGADINLRYLFEKLFGDMETYGQGYPEARGEIQRSTRKKLAGLSKASHLPMTEILKAMDSETVSRALDFPGVRAFFEAAAPSALKDAVLALGGA